MKEPNWSNCTEEEVWEYVGWNLAKNGIQTILVGGAVAAIYSKGIYKSGDLDLVLKTYAEGKITEVMESIGFQKSVGRHYIHPKCDKFVEFMFGPAGIGDDIHFRARECLDQAVLVALKFPFNQRKVKEWCSSEGAPEAYEELMKKIKKNKALKSNE